MGSAVRQSEGREGNGRSAEELRRELGREGRCRRFLILLGLGPTFPSSFNDHSWPRNSIINVVNVDWKKTRRR